MGIVLNYKRWAINQRIKELKKAMEREPASQFNGRRQMELNSLELDLKDLND